MNLTIINYRFMDITIYLKDNQIIAFNELDNSNRQYDNYGQAIQEEMQFIDDWLKFNECSEFWLLKPFLIIDNFVNNFTEEF